MLPENHMTLLGIAQEDCAVKHVSLRMIRRGTLLLVLVYAGCKGHKSCGDGSVAVPSEDPDGGVTCVPAPDEEGGVTDGPHGDGHLPPPDAHSDARTDGPNGFCGDGLCNNGETCSTCPTDCGTCAPFCGDGRCNGTETCSTCPSDCGTCPPDASPPDASGVCPGFTTIFTGSTSGSTVGGTITSVGRSCGGSTLGPERWYVFNATVSGSCHASTTNLSTGYDSVVYIRNGCL